MVEQIAKSILEMGSAYGALVNSSDKTPATTARAHHT